MPVGWTKCPFCGKKIFSIYSRHHQKVCRIRRGLDKREPTDPEPIIDNPTQKRLEDIIVEAER